jgi:alpha-ketoglutarate-dependent taurine dioxygenase
MPQGGQGTIIVSSRVLTTLANVRAHVGLWEAIAMRGDLMINIQHPTSPSAAPLVLSPAHKRSTSAQALTSWAIDHREQLRGWLDNEGAVLFRGWHIKDTEDYRSVATAMLTELRPYIGGDAPRRTAGDGIYDVTSFPSSEALPLHNELSYAGWWPSTISFCCLQPAQSGGQTTVADGRVIYTRLPTEITQRFKELGVTYHQHLRDEQDGRYGGKSWQETFETDSRQNVERYCREYNMTFTWTELGLLTSKTNLGVVETPIGPCWFNQADLWHAGFDRLKYRHTSAGSYDVLRCIGCHAQFGDGSEIPINYLLQIRRTCDDIAIKIHWRPDDVLILNNHQKMHGRAPYTGSRTLLAAMS